MISKIKKMISKHKNKLFILMLTLISTLTLFINIGKTYAYETDKFSYTVNDINVNNTAQQITKNTDNYVIQTITSTNMNINITLNENKQYNDGNILLINYLVEYSNDNITFNRLIKDNTYTTDNSVALTFYNGSNEQYIGRNFYLNFINAYYNQNENYYTNVAELTKSQQFNFSYNILKFQMQRSSFFQNYAYWRFTIYNIDIVSKSELGLTQYYNTYYGQIEDNYNTLLNNYNALQDNYTTLENNYNDLEDNYNSLENDYNTLEDELTAKQNELQSLQNQLAQVQSQYDTMIGSTAPFPPNNLQSSSVVVNGVLYEGNLVFVDMEYFYIEFSIGDFDLLTNLNNSRNFITITANFAEPKLIGSLSHKSWLKHSLDDYESVYFYNGSTLIVQSLGLDSESTANENDVLLIDDYVDRVVIELSIEDVSFYSTSDNSRWTQFGTYAQGYNDGLNANNGYIDDVKAYYESQINDLNSRISVLNSQIADLQDTISVVESSNEMLRDELSTLNENNMTWQKMFFTMADTPLKTVASVLGKDSGNAFLGINLYQTFIGLLTTLAIIWLIKRII